MTVLDYGSQIRDRDARVDRRGGERAMAEERLHVAEIGAAAEQMRRVGVPERVGRQRDADAMPGVVDTDAQPRRL